MRPLGACGRADLVRALASGDPRLIALTAEMLGYRPPQRKTERPHVYAQHSALYDVLPDDAELEPQLAPYPAVDAPFWRVDGYAPLSSVDVEESPLEPMEIRWETRSTQAPTIHLLAPWRELQPRLRRQAAQLCETGELDVDAVVRHLSRGRQLARIPFERRLRWGPRLQLIADRSERLVPFWVDQEVIGRALSALLPGHMVEQAAIWDGLSQPRFPADTGAERVYRLPPPGSLVLVLGDLGCLSAGDEQLHRQWVDFGRRLRDAGCRPVALLPFPPGRCHRALRSVWKVLPWDRTGAIFVTRSDHLRRRAERLLRLVSPALRIEPGFLRAVRLILPAAEADAGTEADAWQHPAVLSTSAAGATLDPEEAKRLRADFADEPPELQRRVLALLRVWRGSLPQEIWFEEIQCLSPKSRALLPAPADLALASRFFEQLSQRSRGIASGGIPAGALSWYRRCERRLTQSAWSDGVVGKALQRLSWALHEGDVGFNPQAGFSPTLVPSGRIRRLALRQIGPKLHAEEQTDPTEIPRAGSAFATLWSANGLVQIQTVIEETAPNSFWETGEPPSWADVWGWDEYGAWVEFSVEGRDGQRAAQRMRWIVPGSFLMGSPPDESNRIHNEGPQHKVTIREGFWLFDTACTQALWQAVMGENTSHFIGSDRPVERVSWTDAQRFIALLNQCLPGLAVGLPSEAQWEYACRAGTRTPFSFGTSVSGEQVRYWEKARRLKTGGIGGFISEGTVPVSSLPANPWGLFEMHGNVFEWVQDAWHNSYQNVPADGSVWQSGKPGAARVIRGGSWNDYARNCRSAYRGRFEPDFRGSYLGFRCARVQVREPGGQGAKHASLARPGPRSGEGRAVPGLARAAVHAASSMGEIAVDRISEAHPSQPVLLRLDTAASAVAALPDAPTVQILTDRERLTLRRTTKPAWASALGRDRFGLWSEIVVDRGEGAPVIQRLRWIPPGRFIMGSPKDEPGRRDTEGPQHPVTFIHGYWLFDTPCTQALWEAVMGKNPSEFKTQDRPVETVRFDDAQRFLDMLSSRLWDADDSGGSFVLPSEAQWEYACRAGTETALYTGPIEILGDADAPALDLIAWYGGNSNQGFELENGQELTWFRKVQYPGGKAGTHPVKCKQPNPWGLYDMLGNVWEWTPDIWHDSYEEAPSDGSPWEPDKAGAAGRVIRGGSWSNVAWGCRSAHRNRGGPGVRGNYLGFRCARVHES